jgi:hypothetical protein
VSDDNLGSGSIYPLLHRTETNHNADGIGVHTNHYTGGMTLREYIAIAALNGMLGGQPGPQLVPPNAAHFAVEYADALLAELAK